MRGLLVVNHFLRNVKFDEIHRQLCAAAEKQGIYLSLRTNAEVIGSLLKSPDRLAAEAGRPDFVLFFDKDIRLAKLLESYGVRLFNSADSIELCDDKSKTYTALRAHGIKMPKTVPVPMSYFPVDWEASGNMADLRESLKFPLVLKECYGSFGEQVYLINNYSELTARMKGIGNKPMLIQEYISTSAGRDARLNVVGGDVAASMYRHSVNGDFRANITNGGKMEPYEPTKKQIDLAVASCRLLGLDFGGVDILFGEDESPVLCEVNSNLHFKSLFDCTGINLADYIISHIGRSVYG